MTTTHRTATALAITAALALGVSGCGVNGNAAPRATTTANPTEAAKAEAFKKSEAALRKLEKMPANGVVKADYVTPEMLTAINKQHAEIAQHGAKVTGQGKFVSIKPQQYGTRPKPTTSMLVCSEGDLRLIDKSGKDITVDVDGKPKPPGVKRESAIYTLESRDGGETFMVNALTPQGAC